MNNLFYGLFFLSGLSFAFSQDDFSNETVKSTPLSTSVFMLEGAGGNMTALLGQDGVFLVDDDFKEMAEKLVRKLKELGGDSPRFIVNTHFHYDHSGGNQVFGPTALIISAKEVRERLSSEQILWKEKHAALPFVAWPKLVYKKSMTLFLNGESIEIVHYPKGHTDGDTVVFFRESRVVSMGDLYFAGMYPIFHPEHHGSLKGYLKNIESILKRIPGDAKIVPGHGPLSRKSDLEKYYKMIVTSLQVVRKGIQEGLTLQQIQKIGIPGKFESFSHGYLKTDRWIQLLYDEEKTAAPD